MMSTTHSTSPYILWTYYVVISKRYITVVNISLCLQ